MKRKHEDSPGRSSERSRKVVVAAAPDRAKSSRQLARSRTMAVLKTNKNNFGSNGLRRSSRKATIERRVWAEPRKERHMKLPKTYSNVSKRGRPRKKVKGAPRSQTKNAAAAKEIVSNNNCAAPGRKPKTNGNFPECFPVKERRNSLSEEEEKVKEDGNGASTVDVEMAFSLEENDEEGTLIVDDECASLQGAVVDEVITDYPHREIDPSPTPRSSISKSTLLLKSYPYITCYENTADKRKPQVLELSPERGQTINPEGREDNPSSGSASGEERLPLPNEEPTLKDDDNDKMKDSPSETVLRIDEGGGEEKLVSDASEIPVPLSGGESDEDDNHVSLSEALAKLVDSEESGQGCESETVTIHPFSCSEEDANKSYCSHLQMNFPTSINISVTKQSSVPTYTRDESSDLTTPPEFQPIIKDEGDPLDSDEKESGNTDSSFSEENSRSGEPLSYECSYGKSAIPPLIKITPKPPVIKTPLKCTECPMRFCTVRSLLWHFGTHESRGKPPGRTNVLLEDLMASWDNPDVPVNTPRCAATQGIKGSAESYSKAVQSKPRDRVAPSRCEDSKKSSQSNATGVSNENGFTSNRDFILKVPIPRLKHHRKLVNGTASEAQRYAEGEHQPIPSFSSSSSSSSSSSPFNSSSSSSSSAAHFVSILPKLPSGSLMTSTGEHPVDRVCCSSPGAPSPSVRKSTCAPFTLKFSPSYQPPDAPSSRDSPLQSPPSSLPLTPSGSAPGAKTPVIPWAESHVNTTRTTTTLTSPVACRGKGAGTGAGSQQAPITVVPVEKLSQLRREIQNSPLEPPVRDPGGKGQRAPLLEKDGLVMINQNLALRIVSAPQGIQDAPKDLCLDLPGGTSCSDSLTILPQRRNASGLLNGRVVGAPPPPDILTIVPQSDPAKTPVKGTAPASPHLMTAGGKVTPDSSQVVKLILLPAREARVTPSSEDETEEEESEESDEGEMVIDVKEEEASMDPLSLCAVTMGGEEESPQPAIHPSHTPPLTPTGEGATPIPSATPHTASPQHLRPILPAASFTSAQSGGMNLPPHQDPQTVVGKRLQGKHLDEEKYQRRKYVCNFCQKRFGWSTDLKRHVILHTGERPFKCKWCPITFTRKFLLQNHMKKIHSQVCKWSDLWE